MTRRLLVVGWLVALAILAPALHAQRASAPAPLEPFVAQVARLWAGGDADGIAALAGADGRIVLELGTTSGGVRERHAAAALRALFAERETVDVRPERAALSGGAPPRGFVELIWNSRARGTTVPRPVTVYFGTAWEGGGWRIRELRVLP